MEHTEEILNYCRQLRIGGIANQFNEIVEQSESKSIGYLEFTLQLLKAEAEHRQQNDIKRRRKLAGLPRTSDLDGYDHSFENGISKTRINQLRELHWLDQGYNLMLMGPSGVGKTMLAGGLCADAIEKGYKAYFRTMEELINILKLKEVTRSALAQYKRLTKADLIIIDDIMLFPMEKTRHWHCSTLSTRFMKIPVLL
jgi:DNA replication protein DnaC